MTSTSSVPLTPELLDRLIACWRNACADDLLHALLPGVSENELNELELRLDLVVPSELRTWWGRLGGASGWPWTFAWDLLSVDEAAAAAEFNRQIVLDVRDDPAVAQPTEWQPQWLPFTTADGASLFFDTADPGSPVHRWLPGVLDSNAAPSLGSLVADAITKFECGYVYWIPGEGWQLDETKQPATANRII